MNKQQLYQHLTDSFGRQLKGWLQYLPNFDQICWFVTSDVEDERLEAMYHDREILEDEIGRWGYRFFIDTEVMDTVTIDIEGPY